MEARQHSEFIRKFCAVHSNSTHIRFWAIPGMIFLATCLLLACQPIQAPLPEATGNTIPAEPAWSGTVTGTVTYLQRSALPPGSVITIQLQDVSRQDVAAEILASQTITTAGENVPIPFELTYDPATIDERFTYALSARISVDGQLRWINTDHYGVLTQGNPLTSIELLVRPAQ